MSKSILEVCAYNIQSCIIAEKAGAGRIELCASPAEGGVTPSYGMIEYAVKNLSIPVYVMIRPRGGNFVYTTEELAIMRKDIAVCKELGAAGIAIGILTEDNLIDTATMKQMVALAYPMGVTCHKAFDRTPDAMTSLEEVITAGCERILTSGLQPTAVAGADRLATLVNKAAGRIIIMPGGGVRSTNVRQLATDTGATELHSSALLPGSEGFVADAGEVAMLINNLT